MYLNDQAGYVILKQFIFETYQLLTEKVNILRTAPKQTQLFDKHSKTQCTIYEQERWVLLMIIITARKIEGLPWADGEVWGGDQRVHRLSFPSQYYIVYILSGKHWQSGTCDKRRPTEGVFSSEGLKSQVQIFAKYYDFCLILMQNGDYVELGVVNSE